MTSFKDFLNSKKNPINKNKLLTTTEAPSNKSLIATEISSKVVNSIASLNYIELGKTKEDKEVFATKIGEIIKSDEFVDKLSEKIGVPKENESEDEFVKRAKETMRTIIKNKLSGK